MIISDNDGKKKIKRLLIRMLFAVADQPAQYSQVKLSLIGFIKYFESYLSLSE